MMSNSVVLLLLSVLEGTEKKKTRIVDEEILFYKVRNFIEGKQNSGARICAPGVFSYSIKENILHVKEI